ncbi:MAG TPA: hypothetical protein VFB54_02655 [Burkholderiales bacterium]|nr:hypothetical protein [Burkholderiales bacterium]
MRMHMLSVVALSMLLGSAAAQEAPTGATVSSVSHFTGAVTARVSEKARKVRVDYRTWSIAPGTKLDALPIKADGDVLYELHSGRLITRSAEEEIERVPGTFWTVRRGERQALETLDDTVVLRTISSR